MSGFRVAPGSRRVRLFLKIVMFSAAALAFGACSGERAGAGPGRQRRDRHPDLAAVDRVENNVGMPLTDVDVAIVPINGATEFKKFVGRIENAEKKDIALGGFYGRDGTTFNLRVVKPRLVRVTGKDLNAKTYNVETRWQ